MTSDEFELAVKQAVEAERVRIKLLIQDRIPHNKEPHCYKCALLVELTDTHA